MSRVRVLHVLRSLGRGGVESWLMNIVRVASDGRIQHDFALDGSVCGVHEREARDLGCGIIDCGSPHSTLSYMTALKGAMCRDGVYDVVHSHMLHFSGMILALARIAKIPVRIAHSHADTRAVQARANFLRHAYLRFASALIQGNATHVLACSPEAGAGLLGRWAQEDARLIVLPYGIDLQPFRGPSQGDRLRREHGIPCDVPVFGHIGRMAPEKNHAFILKVAQDSLILAPEARFVLIGEGPLKATVMARARELGIEHAVVFPSPSTDVASWMTGVFDALVLPSVFEGVPLVLIEAQAAGLPCVVSAIVPDAVDIIPSLLTRLPLDASPRSWTNALLQARLRPRLSVATALEALSASPFDIRQNVAWLRSLYIGRPAQPCAVASV